MVNELSQYDILHLNKSGLGNIEFNNYGTYGNKGYSLLCYRFKQVIKSETNTMSKVQSINLEP
jgi:hypothetical protein